MNQTIPKPLVQTNQLVIVASVALTWISNIPYFLLIPLLAGLSGIALDVNTIMVLARNFLKKHPAEYHQEDKNAQKFNQTIAVAFLGLSFIAYLLDFSALAIVFSAIVFAAATVALCGFCIGCFFYLHLSLYRQRRTAQKPK